MKIAREHLAIADIAAKSDESRVVLHHLLVERTSDTTGRLSAADGFMLAAVPCQLDKGDVPGLITVASLKQAGKEKLPGDRETVYLCLNDLDVMTFGGVHMPRPDGTLRFPDLARIIPRDAHIKASERIGSQVAFNPTYLTKAHKALGGLGTVLWPTGPNSPIVITPITGSRANGYSHFEKNGMPTLPYAVVMPMHVVGGITATGNATKTEAA